MSGRFFVDASVLLEVMLEEAGYERSVASFEAAGTLVTSPIAMLEVVMRLSSRLKTPPADAEDALRQLLSRFAIEVVPVGDSTLTRATQAFARYGKGRHPARLNLGDCISYACAKEHGLALLYKGDDFARTDLA